MDAFIQIVRWLSRVFGVVAAALVVMAIVVVCQMVVMRYFLGASTVWQTEFVTFSLVAATFLGSPYVLMIRGHVNVDLLPLHLSHPARVRLALAASAAALVFCVLVAWAGYELWHEAWTKGWRTDSVWALPLWIPYLPMPVGIGLLSLQYIADIVSLVRGDDMPFGIDPQVKA